MYLRNNLKFDINASRVIGETQYPAGWFLIPAHRAVAGVTEVADIPRPDTTLYDSTENLDGTWNATPKPPKTQAEIDAEISAAAKATLTKLRADTYPDVLIFLATLAGAPKVIKDAAIVAAAEKAKVRP